nr:DUF4102 domain-containing protein [Rahnella perminowiae]
MVHSNGSKYWRFRRTINGKDTTRALGMYPIMTLAEARKARDEFLKSLSQGIDPLHADKEKIASFEEIARQWHARKKTWSSLHSLNVMRAFETHLFPEIGSKAINRLAVRTCTTCTRRELLNNTETRSVYFWQAFFHRPTGDKYLQQFVSVSFVPEE